MRKKSLWLTLSGLMSLSIIAAACSPAAAPAATTTAPTTTSTSPAASTAPAPIIEDKQQQEVVKATSDKPKYGGTLYLAMSTDVTTFAGIESC